MVVTIKISPRLLSVNAWVVFLFVCFFGVETVQVTN